jgi:HSP20 family protein
MTNLVRADWFKPTEPFRDLISLREAMDQLFEESVVRPGANWLAQVGERTLAVDMYETDDAVVVKSAIPGIKAEDLDISVTGDTLTIKGETKTDEEIKEENYLYRERRYGSFCRALSIPVPVVTNKAEAEFENGMLTLTLPKAEEVKPKAIKVKAQKGK